MFSDSTFVNLCLLLFVFSDSGFVRFQNVLGADHGSHLTPEVADRPEASDHQHFAAFVLPPSDHGRLSSSSPTKEHEAEHDENGVKVVVGAENYKTDGGNILPLAAATLRLMEAEGGSVAGDATEKRAPTFRLGKREDAEKRAPTFRLGKRENAEKRAPTFRLGKREDAEKRAPTFRLGRRSQWGEEDEEEEEEEEENEEEEEEKRAPTFRLGRRGESEVYGEKRAPTFRLGKREGDDKRGPTFRLGEEDDEKRAPTFRLGKRAPTFRLGKRAPTFRLGKRAPTFRLGKREDADEAESGYPLVEDHEELKRAPTFRLGKRAPTFRLGKRGEDDEEPGRSEPEFDSDE